MTARCPACKGDLQALPAGATAFSPRGRHPAGPRAGASALSPGGEARVGG
eukprot:CAMPEP_0175756968 /NCGR_PEP_ID=MMETSP0097-20121207/64216_1 /TAXON_ID=311494 /ORGANISM="Alexandrium monilatum, Strain CCMP3105" /LENGTH=49 /DNA_ID= /DNA_START= /DNA_END= /DNA_ORIENTATION=